MHHPIDTLPSRYSIYAMSTLLLANREATAASISVYCNCMSLIHQEDPIYKIFITLNIYYCNSIAILCMVGGVQLLPFQDWDVLVCMYLHIHHTHTNVHVQAHVDIHAHMHAS